MANKKTLIGGGSAAAVIACVVALLSSHLSSNNDDKTAEVVTDTTNVAVADTVEETQAAETTYIAEVATEVETEAETQTEAITTEITEAEEVTDAGTSKTYYFRNDKLLTSHYEKHGIDMGFDSKEDYQQAASDVVNNPDALYKTEEEDGDSVYYVKDTGEFVVVSTDGYIRTYYYASYSYFQRQ